MLEKAGLKATDTQFQSYTKPSQYVESNCFAIKFKNDGNTMARINNKPLAPGQTETIGVDHPYFDTTKYKLTFNVPALGGTRLVWVTRVIASFV